MARANGASAGATKGRGQSNTERAGNEKMSTERASQEISRSNTPGNPLVELLQMELANSMILYMNYKHYHWQTYGPLFRDLHLLFDEFATAVLASTDDIAERIRMIGGDPIADPIRMVDLATVKVAAPTGTMRHMVAEADANVIGVIREIREGAELADNSRDPGTADLFARIVQIHEKHEWFLRDILEEGDGLVD